STYNESGLKTVFPIYLVNYRFSTFGGILQKLPVYGRALIIFCILHIMMTKNISKNIGLVFQ
ncbi:MAG: hypothetical protein P8179_19590, partial [Candidatus Thiodiazotropha sp.]